MAEEVERLGGGDAFSAGYLYGLLTSADVAQALRWGVAVAALKYTIPSDLPLIDHREVRALVEGESRAGVNR
jgi:2-dehydro-3-deoxygluconokinase